MVYVYRIADILSAKWYIIDQSAYVLGAKCAQNTDIDTDAGTHRTGIDMMILVTVTLLTTDTLFMEWKQFHMAEEKEENFRFDILKVK